MVRRVLFGSIILLSCIIGIYLVLLRFRNQEDSFVDIIIASTTVVGSLATAATVIFLYLQHNAQHKSSQMELVFSLYRDFYQSEVFSRIFAILDSTEDPRDFKINRVLSFILSHEPFQTPELKKEREAIVERYSLEHLPSEADLINYMNFFNSIGKLVEKNSFTVAEVEDLFSYQLKTTLVHPIIAGYLVKGKYTGFTALRQEVSIPFFFYGTLKDPRERAENLASNWNWTSNEPCILQNYRMDSITSEGVTYNALLAIEGSRVEGVFTQVETDRLFDFFETIDTYEEVGALYTRELQPVDFANGQRKLCWIYVKK
jgi:hypothetical protein